jgi:hypothetical protein
MRKGWVYKETYWTTLWYVPTEDFDPLGVYPYVLCYEGIAKFLRMIGKDKQ